MLMMRHGYWVERTNEPTNQRSGAFQTIDRPYGPLLNLIHHGIGSTHVLHHLCSSVPHYHAWEATEAIRERFPHLYRHDATPIHRALWQAATECLVVEKVPGGEGEYVFMPLES